MKPRKKRRSLRLFRFGTHPKAGFTHSLNGEEWERLPTLLSIRQTARILRVHPNTLRAWDASGKLRAVRIGSRQDRRYARASVHAVWQEREAETTPRPFSVAVRRHSLGFAWALAVIGIVALGGFFSLLPLARADTGTAREFRLRPQTCSGWQKSQNAQRIELPPIASDRDFTGQNAAHYNAALHAVTAVPESTGVITGGLDVIADAITCSQFVADDLPKNGTVGDGKLTVSLSVHTAPNTTDAFVLEGSMSGNEWFSLATFPQKDDTHYLVLPFTQITSVEQFADLHIRLRSDVQSFQPGTNAALDGIEVVATVTTPSAASASPRVAKRAHDQLDALVAFSQEAYRTAEQPVIRVLKKRTKKFLFFNRGQETWSLEKVRVADADGTVVNPPYHTQTVVDGGSSDDTLTIDPRTLHPGKYTVDVTLRTPAGTSETVSKQFLWGVVALNLTRSQPRPDDEQTVSMAVLDDEGHTICDANITLTVTDPNGKKRRFRTEDGSVATSGVCVDKGVTNLPDYSVAFKTEQQGIYHVRMDAETKAGKRSEETNFEVSAAQQFDVARLDVPTRIYPLASYTARLAVTPSRDFMGVVRERLEASLTVSNPQPEAFIQKNPDDPNEQFLSFLVDWKAGETYFLSYTFDAPDISPELFLLGQLSIGGSFTETPLFTENRQWQLASDSVGAAVSQHLYESGFELQSVTAGVEWSTITGSPVIDTTTVRSGAAALRVQVTGSPATESVNTLYMTETQDDYYFRTYIRIATSVSTQTQIFVGSADSGLLDNEFSLRLNTDDTLELWDEQDTVAQVGSDSTALSKDTWYRLEVRLDTNDLGNVVFEGRIDGVTFASSSTQTLFGSPIVVGVGFITTAATGDVYFDDVGITNDAGGSPENWPGEGKIVHLRPNAAGDTQTCNQTDFGLVDEVTPNDDTDIIVCDANNETVEFHVADTSTVGINANDIINYVAVGNRIKRASAASGSNTARVRVPNGNTLSTGLANTSSTTAWRTNGSAPPNRLRAFDQTDTADNDPITPADVDNTQIGVIVTDGSPATNITAMWLLVEYVTAPGGRLYSSGFELQDVTNSGVEWATVAGTLAISTSVKHGGSASMTVGSLGSTAEESVEQDFVAANDNGPFWGRVYLNVTTLPSAENRIIEFQNSSNTVLLYITLSSTGTLTLYDEDGQVGSASRAITTSVWYRVEFKLDATGTGSTDTIEGKINGETFATDATRNLSTGITSLVIGGNLNGEAQTTGTWNMDDVAVNKNAGSVQNGYPGAGFITHLRPNATGDNSAWTNANTEIDEVTPDDGTTVISSSTADQVEDVNLDSTSTGGIGASDTINLVSVGFRFALDSGSTQSDVAVRIRENTNNPSIEGPRWPVTTTTWQTNSSSASRLPSLTLYDQPLESNAWTTSVLDTTQIGVRLTTDGSTANMQVTALWLLVDYTSKVTIQGNAYSDEGSTAIDGSAANKTVNLLINGFGSDTDEITASSGAWDVQNLTLISGDIVTVYLDGETEKAATIYVSDATAKSDVHLFQNRLIVRADTGSITNANIGTGDNTDTDVPVSVSSGNLTVDSGFELHVYTGDTYAPGGTVTTNATGGLFHLDDSAAVTLANATNTIGTDVTIDTGATLTVNVNTVVSGGDITATGTLTTSSGTPTITMRGTGSITGNGTFTAYNLAIGDGTTAATTFSSSGTNTVNNDVSVATGSTLNQNASITVSGGDFTNTGTGVINTTSGTPTVTVSGTGSIGGVSGSTTFYNLVLSGTPTFGANVTVNNNLTLPSSVTAGSTTVTMAGTSGTLVGGGSTIYNLTINPSSTGTTTLNTSDLTVSNTLEVAADDTLSIAASRTLTHTGATLTWGASSTISGSGTLRFTDASGGPGTGGTLSSVVRYDASSANIASTTFDARTYGGKVELYSSSATAKTVTFATSGTYTTSGSSSHLHLFAAGDGDLTLVGDGGANPTVTIGGDLDFQGSGAGSEVVQTGTGTWTVGGNVNFSDGTATVTSGNTLVMNGTGTLTSNGQTLQNVTLSGTITLANATHTIAGDFSMASGTITAGSSTVVMTASKNLTGGSQTLNNLTVGDGADTVTVTTSGLTVSGTLSVPNAGDTLSINSGLTVSHAGSTLTLTGTISGAGTLRITDTSPGPGSGGTLSSVVRYDASTANIASTTFDARTYGGKVELYSSSGTAKTVTFATGGTYTLSGSSSHLHLLAEGAGDLTLVGDGGANPTVSIGGDLDFTGTQAGTEVIQTGTGTWTVSGNVDLTGGTYTATSGNTLTMNGTSKTLTSDGETLDNLTLSGTITLANATHTIAGSLNLSGTITAGTSTVTMTGTSKTIDGGGNTLNNLIISGTEALQNTDLTASGTLTVDSAKSLTINVSRTLTLSGTSGTTLSLSGTINGPGRLTYRSSAAFPTGGTLALTPIVRYDLVSTDMTTAVRTDYGTIEAFNSSSTGRTLTIGNGTHTLSGNFDAQTTGTGTLAVATDTNNPAVNVTGNVTASAANGAITLSIGSNTWTVSGNVDLTNVTTFNHNSGMLVMSGTGTLTSNSKTLNNVTLSGTITLANATHTVAGNFSMASGTITAGSSTVSMTGSGKTLTGGSQTLNNLTLDGNGTITVSTSGLTVSDTLNVTASDTFAISSGLTMTLSKNTATSLTLSGTINGPGRLTYQNSTTDFPTGGTLAATLITRFDTKNGNMNIPARIDYGAIEAFGDSANARTITLGTAGSQTITTSSHFYVMAEAVSPNHVTLQGATWDPTLNVGGDFDFTGTNTADEKVTAPDVAATWTVTGNVDLSNGTWTASAETVVMNGTANLIGASQTVKNLTIDGSGNTVTVTTSDISVSGTLTIGGAADGNNDTLSIGSGRTVTSGTGGTVTFVASGTDTISGSGMLTVQNSNLDTDGTLSSIVRFDATSGNITMPARTYGGLVEVYSNASDAGKTVTMGAGTHTLSGALNLLAENSQNLTLAGATNNPTVSITGDLDFTGTQAGTEVLTSGTGTWTASGNADFTGGTFTATSGTTLVMNGSSKTLTTAGNALHHFELSANSVTMSGTTTLNGNLTISGGTLTAPSSGALNVAGNWNNSGGTFTDNSSTITLNGSSQQTLAGTMTGTSDFNNLTVTNASGSDPDSSPSVIFSAAATVSGTFTATTANTKLRFNASSTYTFVNVTLNGQATTTRVALRSSSNGTQWSLTSTGVQTVSNTNIRDSNACAGDTIDASDGTNVDAANNSCWTINSISLSISDFSIGFGTLSTSAATWANGGETGSASDTAAHTISVATNAASGYTLTYYGSTLTSGGNTIDVASISNDADGTAGTEQFGIGFSTDGNATIAPGYDHNATPGSRDWTFVASTTTTAVSETGATSTETISAYYLANIAATTEPGSYSTNITYVLSAGF